MKSLLLILLFFISFITVKAQDTIITTKKDTIKCLIISVNAERISYEQNEFNSRIVGRSIETSEVLQYFRSKEHKLPQRSAPLKDEQKIQKQPVLFSIQSGLSHSLTNHNNYENLLLAQNNSSAIVNEYISKLKNGYYFNTSCHYLLTNFVGIGADYSFSYFSSEGEFLAEGYAGMNVPSYQNLEIKEKLIGHFIGASFLFRQSIGKKQLITISETISPGGIFFRSETRSNSYQIYWGDNNSYNGEPPYYYDYSNSINHGKTFAIKGGLSIEYCITPQISTGLTGNYTWAKLHKLSFKNSDNEINDRELEKDVDISRLDYGFVFRYNF